MILTFQPVYFGQPATVTLNKSELLSLPEVAADPYFSQSANVSRVSVEFLSSIGGQREILNFDFSQPSPTAQFQVSERARNSFLIRRIILTDFDSGVLVLDRAQLPSGLDVSVTSQAPSGPSSGTVFLAHFDGSNTDSSAFGVVGTAVSGPNGSPEFVAGRYGSALSVNGGRVEYQLSNQADFGTGDFTIEIFAKGSTSETSLLTIGTIGAGGSLTGGMHIIINYQGIIQLRRENATGFETNEYWNWGPWGPFRGIEFGWKHIAIVRQGTELTVYYDGMYGGGRTIPQNLTFGASGKTLSVGSGKAADGGHYLALQAGSVLEVDELRITKGVALYSGSTITIPSAPF